jgi:RNA polymerase sigma-70 factor (ECF subfamily)
MVAQLPPDFATTLAAARRGDGDAWRELYLEHSSPVLGYLRAQRAPSPEDLLGEVWLQAVRDLARFSGDAAGFRSWLLTIAHHRLLDSRRAQSRRPVEVGAELVGEGPAVETEGLEERIAAEEELSRMLEGIPERQRSVLYLRFVLDLPQKEVARVLGVSTPAMKMLQARAVKSLEKRMQQLDAQDLAGGALPSTITGRLD